MLKLGLLGSCALCRQSAHCLCSQEPSVAGAAAHSNFFCCPDFVVWPSPCSAFAAERRGQGSATIQRSFGFNFCLQQALKTPISPGKPLDLLLWHLYCSQAMAEEKNRSQGHDILHNFPDTRTAKKKKKKKSVSTHVHVLAGLSRISTAFFWKKTAEVGRCYDTNSTAQFRGSLQWPGREMSLQLSDFPLQAEKSHSYPTDMVSNSRSNKKWAGQTWRKDKNPHLFATYLNQITCVFLDQIAVI